MKTKLLKKVRERFEINYYSNGYDLGGGYESDHECMIILDKKFWTYRPIKYKLFLFEGDSKIDAYNKCHKELLSLILNIYDKHGIRRNKKPVKTEEKLWYK